ncbi:MAG: putative Co/Zn/Cd efflux system rane fusion protein [Edaphobacter sp.]|nr:putative Co/Zn/Cd efflux system rane fusion protein [Edaphobacter sp.]
MTKRFVDVGEAVHTGQPLMRIDVTDFAHAITTQTQNVEAAKAKAQQAGADEARYRGLVSTGAVSASTYDQVKANSDAAQAQLTAVEAQAQVAKDEGDYSLLVADPTELLWRHWQSQARSSPPDRPSSNWPMPVLAKQPSTCLRRFARRLDRPSARQSMARTIALRLISGNSLMPPIPMTRTFEARYVLGGAEAKAPLGATVTIQLPGLAGTDAMTVPLAAITDRGKGPGVWALNEKASTVSFQPVKIARLTEWDFLLGVHDETRLGALRFRVPPDGAFIDSDEHLAAPPITSLRELQAASLQFEQHINEEEHPEYERWLTQLFAPGTSLGGARPKASVRDEKGTLCIAKFPSRKDTRDIGAGSWWYTDSL